MNNFDIDAAFINSLVSVNKGTGRCEFSLPLARLLGETSGLPINLTASCLLESAASDLTFDIYPSGTWRATGGGNYPTFGVEVQGVPLSDGRRMSGRAEDDSSHASVGPGYLFDASDFLLKRKKAFPEGADYQNKALKEQTICILHKSGLSELFDCVGAPEESGQSKVLLRCIVDALGKGFHFTWESALDQPRVTEIKDEIGPVLTASWNRDGDVPKLNEIVVYPVGQEKVTYSWEYEDGSITISMKCSDPLVEATYYKITSVDGEKSILTKVAYSDGNHSFPYDSTEKLKWKDGKLHTRTVKLPGAGENSTETYVFSGRKAVVNYHTGKALTATATYEFSEDGSHKITTVVGGATAIKALDLQQDVGKGLVSCRSTYTVDGRTLQDHTSTFDHEGNLVSLESDTEKLEWTYYNNYTRYAVSSEFELSDVDRTINASLLTPWFLLLSNVRPSTNFTSSVVKKFTSIREYATNDYATETFNLPVELGYPGDAVGFCSHIESERFTRKTASAAVDVKITYFGYTKLTPMKNALIDRPHALVLARTLTVLAPQLETIDVSKVQLKIATAAVADMVKALEECAEKTKDDEYISDKFKAAIPGIQQAAKDQSKKNSMGYKLTHWSDSTMAVEEFTYHSDAKKASFGKLASSTSYRLTASGAEIEASRVTVQHTYEIDKKEPRRTTQTTKTTSEAGMVESKQTRDGYGQYLIETVDTQGIKTTYGFSKGRLASEKITQGGTVLQNNNISYALLPQTKSYQIETTGLKGGVQKKFDKFGRATGIWKKSTSDGHWKCVQKIEYTYDGYTCTLYGNAPREINVKLDTLDYDSAGRLQKYIQFDYKDTSKLHSTREVTTVWQADGKSSDQTVLLKDRNGKATEKITQQVSVTSNTEKLVRGNYTQELELGTDERTLILRNYSNDAHLQTKFEFDEFGQLVGSERFKKKGKSLTSLGRDVASYDAFGRLVEAKPHNSTRRAYTYDPLGRLLSQQFNGGVLRYEYAGAASISGATGLTLEAGDKTSRALGSQHWTAWGQLDSQTLNGVENKYTYKGISPIPQNDNQQPAATLPGYISQWDPDTLTYTETCPVGLNATDDTKKTLSTSLQLSVRGKILKMTDIAGRVTAYSYDALGRLLEQRSDACVTVSVYADNGQLQQETIEDIANGRTLTVTYAYDLLGHEVSREFVCDGVSTLKLVRQLTEGRLTKQLLSVNGKQQASDTYTYDQYGRLVSWTADNKSYAYRTDLDVIEQSYKYDELGNVIETKLTGPSATSWSPVMKREFDSKVPGLLAKHSSTTIKSDKKGRWVADHVSYLDNGKVKGSNWLGANYGGNPRVEYTYDDEGRVRALFTTGDDRPRGFQLHYRAGKVYARSQITNNTNMWGGATEKQTILLNESVGCYLSQANVLAPESKASSMTHFELRDAAGTVFASIDSAGNITYHNYSPYGHRPVDPNWDNWLGFKGEVQLPDGGYYLGSYRVYDPLMMSFRTPDSASPFGVGGPAAYVYCGGDPVNFHDPSGHVREEHFSYTFAPPLYTTREFKIGMAVAGIVLAPLGMV
ncbi:RHS repeat-associated core domain-containing protein [Pseudomonas putida]|nr:RHS repeat-associated core domain-containing protein [Pseudomonas putida]